MGLEEGSRKGRRNKHVNWEERIQIETLQREGCSPNEIGERIGRPGRTVRRELERGWVTHRTGKYSSEERYSAVRGQTVHEDRMRAKGRKLRTDPALEQRLRLHIVVHRHSPAVAAGLMTKDGFEHDNRMIRRFIPKGCDISEFTRKQIQQLEDWINNYPRKILDFETAEERFIRELVA